MEPALFREFCEEFTREVKRLRMADRARLASTRTEAARIKRELERMATVICGSDNIDRLSASPAR